MQEGITDVRNVFFSGVANGADLVTAARPTVDEATAESRMEEQREPLSQAETSQRWGGSQLVCQLESTRR